MHDPHWIGLTVPDANRNVVRFDGEHGKKELQIDDCKMQIANWAGAV
jgi:hypothetical protein